MRRLKFRQFVNGKFHYWGFGLDNAGHSFTGPANPADPSRQFTGLMDKNGKDIYECDIVRMHNSMGRFYLAEVRIVDGCSEIYIPTLQQRDYLKCYTCNHAVEIIGNVHENPGMLG